MPQSGMFGFPTDVVVLDQRIDSGSGRWQKPVGLVGRHTVIVRTWGGGGGGTGVGPTAGGGGGFNQRAYDYAIFPSSVGYYVGAGDSSGGLGLDGEDSYVYGDGVDVAATGGTGGTGGGAGGRPAFRYGTNACFEFDFPPYNGGDGGWPGALVSAVAIWGGAGGVATAAAIQPTSLHGGNGSGYDGTTYFFASSPGGGGTTYTEIGIGKAGRVQFIIVRGIVLDLMGNVF